jgi:hypothetical protein
MYLTPYGFKSIITMSWTVLFHDDFCQELNKHDEDLQDELLAHANLLQEFGPNLGRPTVDTLKGSSYPNINVSNNHTFINTYTYTLQRHIIQLSPSIPIKKGLDFFQALFI